MKLGTPHALPEIRKTGDAQMLAQCGEFLCGAGLDPGATPKTPSPSSKTVAELAPKLKQREA